jgi:hypothetical protein
MGSCTAESTRPPPSYPALASDIKSDRLIDAIWTGLVENVSIDIRIGVD